MIRKAILTGNLRVLVTIPSTARTSTNPKVQKAEVEQEILYTG
jgi:hypothetical protein